MNTIQQLLTYETKTIGLISIILLNLIATLFTLWRLFKTYRKNKIALRAFTVTPVEVKTSAGKIVSFVPKVYHKPIFIVLVLALISIISANRLYALISPFPQVVSTYPQADKTIETYDKPIEITFNTFVWKNKVEPHMYPEIAGQWDTSYGFKLFPWTRKLRFYPQQSFPTNQKIMIYLSYIANNFHPTAGNEFLLIFYTPPLPKVIDTSPKNGDQNIAVDTKFIISLDQNDLFSSDWEIESSPEHKFAIIRNNKNISIIPQEPLRQATDYKITLYQTPATYNLNDKTVIKKGERTLAKEFLFQTILPPALVGFTPTGDSVLASSPITMEFDASLVVPDNNDYFNIQPTIAGAISWNETKTILTFTSTQPFSKDTSYTVTFKKGVRNLHGGLIENDISFQFKTIGPVQVSSYIPTHDSINVSPTGSILITFNQSVHTASAESKFSITPQAQGTISWNGNVMKFNPSAPLFQYTRYTITVKSGVESINGLPSTVDYTSSFTTLPKTVSIDVPYYSQSESFTCNIAAVRMALAYRDVYLSEGMMKNAVGTDGTRGTGNPHKGYVEQYGTYWEPLGDLVGDFRPYEIFTNWNLTALLTEVEKGNPVVVWGQNGWATPTNISWTAKDGTYIYAISGMHSYVVKGFTGSRDNPASILINDPWRGNISLSPSVFNSRWSYFKTAMVIY